VQPKYLIVAGAVVCGLSMYAMTNVYGDLGFWFMARSRMLLGVGLPLIFVPIMAASYDGIEPSRTDQASALINAARNTGGSIGVSIVSNVLAHREQFHQSRLVEQVIPSSTNYQDTLQQITNYFVSHGSSLAQAHDQAIQWIGAQVQAQASFLGYMDAFWVLMLISLSAVPLALMLRTIKLGGAVHKSSRRTRSHARYARVSPDCSGYRWGAKHKARAPGTRKRFEAISNCLKTSARFLARSCEAASKQRYKIRKHESEWQCANGDPR